MARLKIAILVDNPLRDLPSCVLLAADLAKKYDVFLLPTAQAATDVFRIAPDLTLLNYLRVSNQALVQKMLACGLRYSVLDTEGGFFMKVPNSDENTYTMTIVPDEQLRSKVAQFFIWGEELWNTLNSRGVYAHSELLCLGTPRMDFYHSSMAGYYAEQTKKKPMILVNTSFAGNNPKFSQKEIEMKMLVKKFAYSHDFIEKFFADLDRAMYAYIDLTKYLAKEFPDVDILVRPHPFEKDEIYRQAFAQFPNVTVSCEGAVGDQIRQSKVLIHYECSTAIEAAFMQVPNFSLTEYRELRPMEHINLITDYRKDFTDISKAVRSVLDGEYKVSQAAIDNLKLIEDKIFFRVDGKAHERIASAIAQWMDSHTQRSSLRQFIQVKLRFAYAGLRSLLKYVAKGFVVPPGKRIEKDEIAAICARFKPVLGAEVSAKPLALSSSFQILRKD